MSCPSSFQSSVAMWIWMASPSARTGVSWWNYEHEERKSYGPIANYLSRLEELSWRVLAQ
jgi:hypothetical protein